MADKWLWVKLMPNVIPSFDGDPNNLSGYMQMSIPVQDPDIYRVFALIDGKFYMEFFIEMEGGPYIGIHTESFANGPHFIKIVSMDVYGNVICSTTNEIIFNNELSNVAMGEGYELGKPYSLYAFGSSGASYIVEVNDSFDDNTVYSGNFTGDIQAVIPAEAFAADHLIYDLTIENSANPEGQKIYAMLFKEMAFNRNSAVRMIISVGSEVAETYCSKVIEAIKNAGYVRLGGTNYVIPLPFRESSWDNVRRHLQLRDVKIWAHIGHGTSNSIAFNDGEISASRLEELGFKQNPKLNFVYFHTCDSASSDQFAEALGILPIEYYDGLGIRAFIGWNGDVYIRDTITILLREYNTYTKLLWEFLGSGNSLHTSIQETERECRENESIPQPQEITENLRLYGISDDPHHDGSERTYLSYPNIYSPTGW
jgi:hypothetical protein